jgi:hypothetical protein
MALIALAADKGAPGVTTAAVALAAVWPRSVLLAECDVAGSDLPYRLPGKGGHPLAQDRGVVSLASAVRGSVGPEVVWEHTQELAGGLPVLVGPAQPEQAAAMASAWTPISGMLAGLPGTDVIADCGRVLGESPVVPVLRRADLIVLIARDTVEGVAHLRHALLAVARAVNAQASSGSVLQRTVVLLVTDRRKGKEAAGQVRRVLAGAPGLGDVPVLGAIAYDPVAAAGLSGQWGRKLDKSALVASARTVARDAHARVHAEGPISQGSGHGRGVPAGGSGSWTGPAPASRAAL